MQEISLEQDLSVTLELSRLKEYLGQHPEQAEQLAIDHLHDFLVLEIKYEELKLKNKALKSPKTLSLPSC